MRFTWENFFRLPILNGTTFCHLLSPDVSSGIQTLDLGMASRVFYHCATVTQPPDIGLGWKCLPTSNALAYCRLKKKKFCCVATRMRIIYSKSDRRKEVGKKRALALFFFLSFYKLRLFIAELECTGAKHRPNLNNTTWCYCYNYNKRFVDMMRTGSWVIYFI